MSDNILFVSHVLTNLNNSWLLTGKV